ncbi:unnamed protein product [Pleuronectes platessa]|uniref:Uncharacterized protein n=1 Tax=Pleuronectes platessa TaxID=8262 RepID=A0A9N7YPG6_PLEPL|nr:unnamed protein product [Pleuronectes platessa]
MHQAERRMRSASGRSSSVVSRPVDRRSARVSWCPEDSFNGLGAEWRRRSSVSAGDSEKRRKVTSETKTLASDRGAAEPSNFTHCGEPPRYYGSTGRLSPTRSPSPRPRASLRPPSIQQKIPRVAAVFPSPQEMTRRGSG